MVPLAMFCNLSYFINIFQICRIVRGPSVFLSELVEFDFVLSRYFSVGARGVSKVTFPGFRSTSSNLNQPHVRVIRPLSHF